MADEGVFWPEPPEFRQARFDMIQNHIASRGVDNPRVLEAMRRLPRHYFLSAACFDDAHEDRPLPIGAGQTISQPYIVALMTAMANPGPRERVLEVGTGSGYQAALLALLAGEVHTIERKGELAGRARQTIAQMGIANVFFHSGDGTLGLPEHAPYDVIMVTAACPHVPGALPGQLAEGGRMVAPVGPRDTQELVLVKREKAVFHESRGVACRFVPLLGRDGWAEGDETRP